MLCSIAAAAILCVLWIVLGSRMGTTLQALTQPAARPPFYTLLPGPLAQLSTPMAFRVWLGIQMGLLLICWFWAVRRFGPYALIWGALSAPCGVALLLGQDSVLLLAIAAGGYALAKGKQFRAAGAVLALGLVRFDLVLFLVPALMFGRRWKMLGGFIGMGAALLAGCLALSGVQGLESYAAQLGLDTSSRNLINLKGLLANLGLESGALQIGLAFTAFALSALVLRERLPLWRWMTLTITTSLLVAPHVYIYDAAIMILPVWLVLAYSRKTATRAAFALFATPLPFLAGLAPSPWPALTPLCLAGCLSTLAWEAWAARRDRREQFSAAEAGVEDFTLAEPVL